MHDDPKRIQSRTAEMQARQQNIKQKTKGNPMAKIIKKLRYVTVRECEESDPIYSEGWTIGGVIGPRQVEKDKNQRKPETEEPREEA